MTDQGSQADPFDRPMAATNDEDIAFDYATSIADSARALMVLHAIPPTPDNFAVWFQYSRGSWPQLNSKRCFQATLLRACAAG